MLFRGESQTYNEQIHTEELSLTRNMEKYNAVHSKVISRFKRYNKVTSFLSLSGRVDGGYRAGKMKRDTNDEINDNAYRVKFQGLMTKPAFSFGAVVVGAFHDTNDMSGVSGVTYQNGLTATTVITDTLGSIAVKHDPDNDIFGEKFNPGDSIKLDAGLGMLFMITQHPVKASTGDHYILHGKFNGSPADFDESHFIEDEVFLEGGNYFGEGSLRGFQRSSSSYWKIYYSLISRYGINFTGNALRQKKCIWVSPDKSKTRKGQGAYWQYEAEWEGDQYFSLFLELACRYSVPSMDPTSHAWFENFGQNALTLKGQIPELGLLAPRTPEGWVEAIKDTIDLSYDVNTGFSPDFLESILLVLTNNSPAGIDGNTILCLGDQLARKNFDKAMKKLLGWDSSGAQNISGNVHTTNLVKNLDTNEAVDIGFEVKVYRYLSNKIVFMTDDLLNNPSFFNRSGGIVGTGNMYMLNITEFDGVSNFELFSGGRGRIYRKKYINGMHSLKSEGESSIFASSGFDGASCETLSELFPIVYVPDTCCIVRGTGKYDGGALAGTPGLEDFPSLGENSSLV